MLMVRSLPQAAFGPDTESHGPDVGRKPTSGRPSQFPGPDVQETGNDLGVGILVPEPSRFFVVQGRPPNEMM